MLSACFSGVGLHDSSETKFALVTRGQHFNILEHHLLNNRFKSARTDNRAVVQVCIGVYIGVSP